MVGEPSDERVGVGRGDEAARVGPASRPERLARLDVVHALVHRNVSPLITAFAPYLWGVTLTNEFASVRSARGGRLGPTGVGRRRLAGTGPGAEQGDDDHAEPVHGGGDQHDDVDDRNQARH